METALKLGFADFLSPEDGFRSCTDTGQAWANRAKPGIYFWLCENGEAYVGQSIKPQARLRQHMKVHADLRCAAFRPCPSKELDRTEARLIREVGDLFLLRNIKLAVSTASDVPFDNVASPKEQEAFVLGADPEDISWRTMDHLTRIQARKFDQFLTHPHRKAALGALRMFIERAVPRPAATEVRFWSVSLRPKGCFIRVNAGQQEVFTHEVLQGKAYVRVLTDERVHLLRSTRMRYQTTSFETEAPAAHFERWLAGKSLCRAGALWCG